MHALITKFETYLDTLSRRDQISIAVIALVVVLMLWITLIYSPMSDTTVVLKRDLLQSDTNLVVAQAKMNALQKSLTGDPDRESREQLIKYVEDNKKLDQALAQTSTQIINPQQMAQLLQRILESQSGLKFVSLKNKQSTPEFVESSDEGIKTTDNVSTIYRHSVVLQVEGSYHSALAYLQKLEQLPWRFFWQSIEIETIKYPATMITLEVYTLGFREGLIGV